jgi:hypothetical protein
MRQHVIEMVGGPGTLRFLLQPMIAIMLGILHGVRDARKGRPPYLLALAHARGKRLHHLGDGLRAIVVPLCLALAGALTFQYLIRSRIYVAYGLLYATLFVAAPYFAIRGLANRLASNCRTTPSL